MEPLDLSKHPPRSPYERLDGLVMMPRTIDKMRAMLPGGNVGHYKIPGFSQWLLEGIGVREEDLLEAVAEAKDDEDVAAWLREHAETAKYASVSDRLAKRTLADSMDPATLRQRYPILDRRPDIQILFDLLVEDDREMFGTKA